MGPREDGKNKVKPLIVFKASKFTPGHEGYANDEVVVSWYLFSCKLSGFVTKNPVKTDFHPKMKIGIFFLVSCPVL